MSFNWLKDEISKRSEIIESAIKELLPVKDPEGLYVATRHLFKAGGKRLRPVLSLVVSEALNRDYRKILPSAVAIETIHNFTLIHDDIMDQDEMRRGVKTVHNMWGEPVAILAGDTLFSEAFYLMTFCDVDKENLIRGVRTLADVCVKICEGQYLDMSFEEREKVSEEEYIEMVTKKTSVLIAASCALPAILFGEDEEVIQSLWDFGIYSGIGFQIHDDVLDLVGRDKTGKDWASDILEGKKTIITIKAFEQGRLPEIFGKGKASTEEIEDAVKILEEIGAISYASNLAEKYIEMAKEKLNVLPNSNAKRVLEGIADYFVKREY
ncbi:farnesyl-diphosphate synthase /geranylgeranyl-diphosphate synthase [Archaeoglobus sulfaticallidus PM70-1]|uniref:Farnesyl-diphosphate synthase /geranylgeranyl-diphosphate synthase n=1 Tax=Archaeoglobus sulfaticallidus PM70-1 TaxID=387631 RepID=N0BK88_9EURY|nr:polyprenyl synthetase family protein [Archaeoglobus sulfaticallidus]AGK60555.1 farnesyl-diphosphate synthase /geranylgeranyl-diphosphate synthase [Archaeoglobus sulfaticallidus PM70-1]